LATYALGASNPPPTINRPSIPLICIPTTLSGGEYFALAGGTNDSTDQKIGFLHSGMGPNLVILDPTLCLTTPSYHWLSTGVRAVDHCVEALCSLEATRESDERAERGLRLLVPALIACKEDGEGVDVAARKRCQEGVRWAMENIRAGVPMGGSHAIGHQLGPLGVPHGVTSCIMCPAVMRFNVKNGAGNPEIVRRQEVVGRILWSEGKVAEVLRSGLEVETSDLCDALDVLIRFLDLPRTLGDFDISADKIPTLAKNTLEDFWARTNPVPLVNASQVEEILNAVR
jgi:alcohol dehydrogenase class IV